VNDLPEGFQPDDRPSPFLDLIGPVAWKRETNGDYVIGLRIETRHCNTRGTAHGGLLNTLADITLGRVAAMSQDPPLPLVTASLNMDFLGAARIGDWLEVHVEMQQVGRSLAFANAYLSVGERLVARASAVFHVPALK